MKCIYQTINYHPHELLKKCGFTSVTNGWEMKREYDKGGLDRIHALTFPDNIIDIHEDFMSGGKHVTRRNRDRLKFFIELFEKVDLGEPVYIKSDKRKKYPGLGVFHTRYGCKLSDNVQQ